MNTLILDARKLGDGGIGVYIENVVDGLLSLSACGEFQGRIVLLVPPLATRSALVEARLEEWGSSVDIVVDSARKYSFSEYCLMPLRHRALFREASLYHSPHITLPYFLPLPTVATIHDALLLSHAKNPLKVLVARQLIASTLQRAQVTVTVSERSKSELQRLLPQASRARIQVVHNAVAKRFTAQLASCVTEQSKKRKILWIGSEKPHKGLGMFLEALEMLPERESIECHVVAPEFSEATASRLAAAGVRSHQMLSKEEIVSRYESADVLVLSSNEEGCGLPAIEALAMGVAVVSTPLESVKEMCGDAARYADAFEANSLAQALQIQLQSSVEEQRTRSVQGRLRLAAFTPLAQARKLVEVYDLALARSGGSSFFARVPTVQSEAIRSVG